MNEKTDTVVVKIIDRESEEVIRQIPSEEFLKIAEALNEQIDDIRSGLLVQQKA
jgi:flagellar protein FlaG